MGSHSENGIGRTVLQAAASNGHLEKAQLLLDQGADSDANDWTYETALNRASQNGNIEVARLHLDRGVNNLDQHGVMWQILQLDFST